MKNKIVTNKLGVLGLFLTIIIGLFSYYTKSLLGFPDGHLTAYERLEDTLVYPIFFCVNTLFLLAFIVSFYAIKKVKLIFLLYIITLVLFKITQQYFSTQITY